MTLETVAPVVRLAGQAEESDKCRLHTRFVWTKAAGVTRPSFRNPVRDFKRRPEGGEQLGSVRPQGRLDGAQSEKVTQSYVVSRLT